MAPAGKSADHAEHHGDENDIQRIMVQQAEAAAVSEHDATDMPVERLHIGHVRRIVMSFFEMQADSNDPARMSPCQKHSVLSPRCSNMKSHRRLMASNMVG